MNNYFTDHSQKGFRTCFASGYVAETQWAKGHGVPK